MAEVFDRDIKVDPSTVIHAAQMLPTMARLKHPAVNAYLIELIGDAKTHDVVRLHALKAMEKVMPARQQLDMLIANAKLELEDFKSKEQTAERQYHVKNVVALCNFIEEPMTKSDPDAIATRRFLRREAIIALAKAEVPAVTAHPKAIDKKLDGLVAPTFIRVIAKAGGLQPAPTLQEKIEAALGLCAMQYPNMPEYNADLGVYFVGQTMLEFVNDYSKDWLNFTNGGAGKKLPKIAYKTEAKRFQTGLKQLKDHASANREFAHKNTRQMAIDLDALTGKLMLAKIITLTAFDGERVQELDAFLTKSRPKDEYPFKSLKGPKVPLD
jgi:hypothetical protein